ncbi:MAG TPA: SpoVR family protein [Syntrophomonadaceae bacterium]|nr:SpoVR family protein [Syntrophomonadaceae bacterium]
MGNEYRLQELQDYSRRLEELAAGHNLNCYPQEFELVSYEDMLAHEAYLGMPARYPHWSFGKAYERRKTFYRYNLVGLPYEMVINSNPCLAYLMKDNTLLLQILTMAHVYGHNDFFKNNRLFREGTRAEYALEMFKGHADRVRLYISDPSIGYERVERMLDAAHALRFQTYRVIGEKHLDQKQLEQRLLESLKTPAPEHPLLEVPRQPPTLDLNKIPLQPQEDLLLFLIEHGKLNDWEKDLLAMVREESLYFLPQVETKIMNEGWASFWHFHLMSQLNLEQGYYLEFLKRHNQIVCPVEGGLNPYHLGYRIFEKLEQEKGLSFIFQVRSEARDASFLARFLDLELCRELNLFAYRKRGREFSVTEVADEKGWKTIRDTLVAMTGINNIPSIRVLEAGARSRILYLEHEYDGRELQMEYAHQTLKYIARLWGGVVRLKTKVRDTPQLLESDGT